MTNRSYSLLLINPKRKYRYHWDLKEVCTIMGRKTAVHPLALPTLAALTPEHYRVTIIDEEIEPLSIDTRFDLVGITALVPNVKRAYEIADAYRAIGVPVIMGGPQVSFNIDETLKHADTVVAGEAEGVWEQALRDFESGCLKKVYRANSPPEFKQPRRPPRWELLDTKKIMALGVQVSRGCPYKCDFCLVRNMFGQKQRYRDIDTIIEEIRGLPTKQITFVDDNLTANKAYARELMERLKPLGVSWMCQASLDIADDTGLLDLMAQAGCTSVLLGFESVNPASISEMNKPQNRISHYEQAIDKIHQAGIHVIASFIVGFESDHLDAFGHISDFICRNNLSYVMLNLLSAYPGTDLYKRMLGENRLCTIDPDLLNGIYPTLQYRNMSQTDMFHRYFETLGEIYSLREVRKKALAVLGNGQFKRFPGGDLSPLEKMHSLLSVAREYLITTDLNRPRLLFSLMKLAITGRANIGCIVQYLLFIASFHGYLRFTRKHREQVLDTIARQDRGALVSSALPHDTVATAHLPR